MAFVNYLGLFSEWTKNNKKMVNKKIIYGVIACLAFISISTAQGSKSGLSFGLKAGGNLSNVYDTEGENFVASSKFGFAGGGFVTVPLGEMFAFQPEILFSQKGFKGEGTLLGSSYRYERTTTFLDVPILFAFRPIKYVSILAGPQYSFLLSEKNTFSSAVANGAQEQQFDNDNIRNNIFGFTGGVDLNLTDSAILGLRAGWDLQQNNENGNSTTPRYRNVWYQATIGYRF